MSQGYKLVQRSSKPGDNTASKKYYAQSKSNGVTNLNTLCAMISARSSISSADVKAVLDSMNFVLNVELKAGRLVQMGELGSFRITVGSEGSDEKKSFTSSMIRKPKITFTPGESLRETRNNVKFQRMDSAAATADTNDETDDGNVSGEPGDI